MIISDTPSLAIATFLHKMVKKKFHYHLWAGICSVWWVTIDIYTEVVMETHFVLLPLIMYLLSDK